MPGYGCVPGQSGNSSIYPSELKAIGLKLQAFANSLPKKASLVFAITTPFLCNATTDGIIANTLNVAAKSIMQGLGIPVIDLHTPIVEKCGAAPVAQCFGVTGCFCPHCATVGYEYLANTTIAPALRALLQ